MKMPPFEPSPRCFARKHDGTRCTKTATETRSGIAVCGTHRELHDQYVIECGSEVARIRTLEGRAAVGDLSAAIARHVAHLATKHATPASMALRLDPELHRKSPTPAGAVA